MTRTTHPERDRSPRGDKGIALIVALLVMVIMTLLGVPFLLMGETENRIAENERLSLQALYAAEAGARMVVRWFDRPMNVENVSNPTLAAIDRTLRMIDDDGDPATAAVPADGTVGAEYYKQAVDTVFEKPYRGSLIDALYGTETGPDMRIDDGAPGDARDYLEELSQALLGDFPGGGLKARISRIDVYEPPYVQVGGVWTRYGVGTIKVIARIYQVFPDGSKEVLAERMVKVVINEIPYNPAHKLGVIHTCGTLRWQQHWGLHWGLATSTDYAFLVPHVNADWVVGPPRVNQVPTGNLDLLWGYDDDDDWDDYYKDVLEEDGYQIQDPWFRMGTKQFFEEANPTLGQLWPFSWTSGSTPLGDEQLPYDPDVPGPDPSPPAGVVLTDHGTHSNYFQMGDTPGQECIEFPYEMWKRIARKGGLNVYYYSWVEDDKFMLNGAGDVKTFREITDNKAGLFFFDTNDSKPPRKLPAGGFDNLTPDIRITGGTWSSRGMIFLNAVSFGTSGVTGRTESFSAPGEPFQDKNQNGRWDSGEKWLNLTYPTQLLVETAGPGKFFALKDPTGVRDSRGPVIVDQASFSGVFYNTGKYDSSGDGTFHGSLLAYEGIDEYLASTTSPEHYWNEDLREGWPTADLRMPRVTVTRWETDL